MKPTDANHTRGPWRVVERPEQGTANGRRIVVQSPGSIIADCDWNSPATNRANAELIASAPTLLAERDALRAEVAKLRNALTRVVAHDGDCIRQDQWFELRDVARVALAPTT